ncbi:hypothetical protein B795N_05040 [Marinilactibacillus psychrotolerans]|nr:hypothetical protein B795N_05040 [Marinilactibacillus psychrotolerans]
MNNKEQVHFYAYLLLVLTTVFYRFFRFDFMEYLNTGFWLLWPYINSGKNSFANPRNKKIQQHQ